MENSQKGSVIALLMIVAIVLFGVGIYAYMGSKGDDTAEDTRTRSTENPLTTRASVSTSTSAQTPNQVKSTDTTKTNPVIRADWKTHVSDLYKYEMKVAPGFKFESAIISNEVSNIDHFTYSDKNAYYSFEIFARDKDFIIKDCLNISGTNKMAGIKMINGNAFSVVKENQESFGMKDVIKGSIESEYHIMHNNQCYIVKYRVAPDDDSDTQKDLRPEFETLNQMFATFKFTN